MPADRLAVVLQLHSDVAVHGAIIEPVVADGVVAVEFEMNEVNDQSVARLGAFDIERPGLRIAAKDSLDAIHIASAGVYRSGVDSVARRNRQHGLVEGRELTVEDRRRKFMALRCAVFEPRRGGRRKTVLEWMAFVRRIGFDRSARDDSVLDGCLDIGRYTAIAGGQQVEA